MLVACAAAVWWSVDLTFLQPASELRAPYPAVPGTYWARDIRFSLIVLVAVAFVWARGDRRSACWALLGALSWVAVDLVLDRADVSGTLWCIWLAGLACALLAGLWRWRGRRVARPSSRVLLLAAGMAAGVAAVANMFESGDVAGAGEDLSRLVCGGVGLAAALGCSLAARRGRVAAVMPTVIWLLATALIVVRYLALDPPDSSGVLLLPVLFIALAVQAGLVSASKEYLLVAVVSLLAVPVAFVAVMMSMSVGFAFVADLLTVLAGGPAVNSSDMHGLDTLAGGVLGGAYGLALMGWQSASEKRDKTSDPRPA